MKIRILLSTLFIAACATTSQAGTICAFSCGSSDGSTNSGGDRSQPGTGAPLTVTVNGDLYLDHSIFSNGATLGLGVVNLSAGGNVAIDSPNVTSFFPTNYNVYTFNDSDTTFNNTGTWLLFSSKARSGGTFSATGNIFIGNYSPLAPVPIPSSALLFLTSINIAALFKLKKFRGNERLKTVCGVEAA